MDISTFLHTYAEDPWRGMRGKGRGRGMGRRGVGFVSVTDLGYLEDRPLRTLLSVVNKLQSPESLILGILPPFLQQDCGVGLSNKPPPELRDRRSRVHRPPVFILLRSKDRISSLRVLDVRPEEYSAIILSRFRREAQVKPDTIRVYL